MRAGAARAARTMASSPENLSKVFERVLSERQSTLSQITDILEVEILSGALKPGERLREARLAEAFSVSRNTVREALRVLERKGLIRHVPHRGAEVTKLSSADVNDVYKARGVLEAAGLRSPAARSATALERLRDEVEGLEAAGRDGNGRALLEHDFAFHRMLVEQIGSGRLEREYASLQRELRLVLSQLDSFDPMPQTEEHRMIVESLAAGRIEEAEGLLARHLAVAAERVAALVGSQA